jgi:hypothetical protein
LNEFLFVPFTVVAFDQADPFYSGWNGRMSRGETKNRIREFAYGILIPLLGKRTVIVQNVVP